MLIAVPAFRISCGVGIDKGRAWSAIEEVVAWALTREPMSIAALAEGCDLPKQVIVACLTRLMRFRLVEAVAGSEGVAFKASAYGSELIGAGRALPFLPKREKRRISFFVECVSGAFFPRRQFLVMSRSRLDRDPDKDVRFVNVAHGTPSMDHEANMARLSRVAPRGWDEQIAMVDARTATCRPEFLVMRVVDGVPRNVPETAGGELRQAVERLAAMRAPSSSVTVSYAGVKEQAVQAAERRCAFDPDDLVIGGEAQRLILQSLIRGAHRRLIIHSTFLDAARFRLLMDDFKAACRRGVVTDLLWGAAASDGREDRNAVAAAEIAKIVRGDPDLRRFFRIRTRPTGSHAKALLADTRDGTWVGAVGSCNWISSPFRSVEVTVVLRDQTLVADLMGAFQRLTGRAGIADELAGELHVLGRSLRSRPATAEGPARMTLVSGSMHDKLMRRASGRASSRMMVGTHRLGSVARPGMVIPAEVAAGRPGVDVSLVFTRPSGPLRDRDAAQITEEALRGGVRLLKAETVHLHGKFLAWDDDDLVVTSLNWGSADTDDDFPEGELGIHINSAGIARTAFRRFEEVLPALRGDGASAPRFAEKSKPSRKRRRKRRITMDPAPFQGDDAKGA